MSGDLWAFRLSDGKLFEVGGLPFIYWSQEESGSRRLTGEVPVRVVVLEKAKLEALEAELARLRSLAK